MNFIIQMSKTISNIYLASSTVSFSQSKSLVISYSLESDKDVLHCEIKETLGSS